MSKGLFFLKFLILFAALLTFWRFTPGERWYTAAILETGGAVGQLLHGWLLEPSSGDGQPVWVRGEARVRLAIQFDALSVGLVPLLALLLATPGIQLRRRLRLVAVGTAIFFLFDAVVVALFPLLVYHKNAFTDVTGTFIGLIAFVGAPAIIWFALTFRELRQWLPSFDRVPASNP
jgi:hypothetical protein